MSIAAVGALPTVIHAWQGLLEGLLAPLSQFLFAAPKNRRPKRITRIRFLSQVPKPMKNIVPCPICKSPKLKDHLCDSCYKKYLNYRHNDNFYWSAIASSKINHSILQWLHFPNNFPRSKRIVQVPFKNQDISNGEFRLKDLWLRITITDPIIEFLQENKIKWMKVPFIPAWNDSNKTLIWTIWTFSLPALNVTGTMSTIFRFSIWPMDQISLWLLCISFLTNFLIY